MVRFFILTISLLALFLASDLAGQDLPEEKKRTKVEVVKQGSRSVFRVHGKFKYPDSTILVLGVKFKDSSRYVKWYQVTLENKQFKARLGPYNKPLMPGNYCVEVWFKINKQPQHIAQFLRQKYNLSPHYSHKVETIDVQIGTKGEIRKYRKELGEKYLDILKRIVEVYQKTNEKFNWADFSQKKQPPSPDEFKQFLRNDMGPKVRKVLSDINELQHKYRVPLHNDWLISMKQSFDDMKKLIGIYFQFYQLDSIQNKEARLEREKKLKRDVKLYRLRITKSFHSYRKKIKNLIDPGDKTTPKGEEGVE